MIQQPPVVGRRSSNNAVKRERRRSKKMFETEEMEQQAFLSSETTMGVISALLLTISFAELLLSPSSYDMINAGSKVPDGCTILSCHSQHARGVVLGSIVDVDVSAIVILVGSADCGHGQRSSNAIWVQRRDI